MAYQIETIAFKDLSDADRAAWTAICHSDAAYESPYHRPEYHDLVEHYQGGVKLSLARQDGQLVAILPWQGERFARPSGSPLSDYQAIIGGGDSGLTADDMLRRARVGAFHFTAMPDPSDSEDAVATARIEIDNPDAWREAQNSSYRRHMKSTRRRIRKAEDEIGPPRTVMQSRDIDAYQALMRWKSEKFAETGKYDVLNNPGTSGMLRDLWERDPQSDLRADLQVLYFGDRIAACDLGLTDGTVFHSWIVGYDDDLMTYAPGIQLLEATISAAPDMGYKVIDLGPGLDGYKRHYATHSRRVQSGVTTLPGTAGAVAALYDRAETAWQAKTHDLLGKLRRRYSQVAACDPSLTGRMSAMWHAAGYEIQQTLRS